MSYSCKDHPKFIELSHCITSFNFQFNQPSLSKKVKLKKILPKGPFYIKRSTIIRTRTVV